MKSYVKEIINKRLSTVLFTIVEVLIAYFLLEGYDTAVLKDCSVLFVCINLSTILGLYSILLVITHHRKTAMSFVLIIAFVLGMANHLIASFRGNPVMGADLFSLGTAADVAGHYGIRPDKKTVIIFAIFVVGLLITDRLKNKADNTLIAWLMSIIVIAFYLGPMPQKLGMLDFEIGVQKLYDEIGGLPGFICSFRKLKAEKPLGYSLSKVDEIIKPYMASDDIRLDAAEPEDTLTPEDGINSESYVNLIVIVNESFSDLSRSKRLKTNSDALPYLHSLEKSDNAMSTTLVSSIYGGNTANSEFEFLTGFSEAFEGYGMVTFQSIDEDLPTINDVLKLNGYEDLKAFHPGKSDSWRRDQVFPLLGFDEFVSGDAFETSDRIRGFVSDRAMYEKMISYYDDATKKPVYQYGMTIQNHGGYEGAIEDYDGKIVVQNPELRGDEKLDTYLNLAYESDAAFKELCEHYEGSEDKTVIVFFGDHQPGMDGETIEYLADGDTSFKYESPVYIWSNFEMDNKIPKRMSINFLSAYLCELLGYEQTPFMEYENEIRKTLPVITMNGYEDKDGRRYKLSDKKSPYYDLLNEYAILQYNAMHDHDNMRREFFYGK